MHLGIRAEITNEFVLKWPWGSTDVMTLRLDENLKRQKFIIRLVWCALMMLVFVTGLYSLLKNYIIIVIVIAW